MEFKRISLPAQPYLYVERSVAMDGAAIAEAMGSGFGEVFGFTEEKGIARLSMPATIYLDMPEEGKMSFRAAIFVSAEDAAKADGAVKACELPACDAFTCTHKGSYTSMNESHQALWAHMAENGIEGAMPIWEVYVDDPTTVAEAECKTEIYRMVV